MQSANPRRWAALGLIALAQFMVIMDTSIIGVALPEIRTDLGFGAERPLVGLQRLRHRLRRAAAARRPALRPARRPPRVRRRLGDPRRRIAGRRARRDHRRRDRRPCSPGRRRGADRTIGADAADDALRLQPEGAHEGLRHLRRRRTRRRHRRRVPRRRDHRVDLLAVGLLRQHPDRDRRAGRDPGAAARLPRAPRLDRHRRRAGRDRRPRADGVRRRPRARGGLGLARHARRDRRRPRAAGRVRRHPGRRVASR